MINITQHQRVLMIQNGMNPLNDAHVQAFLKGKKLNAVNENMERIKAVLGDKVNANLGSANDRDRDVSTMVGTTYNGGSGGGNDVSAQQSFDPRQAIAADMQDYNVSDGSPSLGGIQSLREAPMPQQQKTQLTAQKLQENANTLATNYYNAFITSLKNPGTQSNIDVFNALKKLLEYEVSIKKSHGEQARGILQESVNNVTRQMYQNLKG